MARSVVKGVLTLGDNTLPVNGIGEIPIQLAVKLPSDSILLNTRVVSVDFNDSDLPLVTLESGEIVKSELVVIMAVEEPTLDKILTGRTASVQKKKSARSTISSITCFSLRIWLSYGSLNKALASVTLIGLYENNSDDDLRTKVVKELSGWFGASKVESWQHLRTYRIGFAQPNQSPPTDLTKDPKIGSDLYLCGDYVTSATFDGALVSGRGAVEALLKDRVLAPV
ncbi:hypothetical protein V6N12_036305 [Hibiscus sabdariffa]|uniref:Amine oxidase domain-containing protein n=1 Tax=Hibiscus sabdariffa TaxID=183260 RepID=A0ABR2EQ79_9ROSI